jgi:hypothetical protein
VVSSIRLGTVVLGIACSGLGMYGAYEFGLKLEGNTVTYIVLAAPVIAGAAAIIPVLAEATWHDGAYLKALLWWAVLVPAGAVVFYSAAERVHVAKAGAQAERDAFRGAVSRAEAALTRAQADLAKARAEANVVWGQKQCGTACRTRLAAETAAHADVEAARRDLLLAEKTATADSPLQAPTWLLPAALDLVAFMAIWTGFSKGPVKGGRGEPARRRRRRVQRLSKSPARRPVANDNVVPFSAA